MKRLSIPSMIPALLLLVLVACSNESPADLTTGSPVLAFHVDPHTLQLSALEIEGRSEPLAPAAEGEPQNVNAYLELASFTSTFGPDNTLTIEASFTNIGDKTLIQPFTFEPAPETSNIASSTEPVVSDDDLGGNGRLAPAETTSVLTFEVIYLEGPFNYVVDAFAVVVEPLPLPSFGPGPNCSVDEFSITGQGFRSLDSGFRSLDSGFRSLDSIGGLFLVGPGDPPDPSEEIVVRLVEPTEVGQWAQAIDGASSPQQDVAILVIDNFSPGSGPAYELGDDVFELPDLIGSGDLETAFQELIDSNQFSHGALVSHEIRGLLAGAGFDREVTIGRRSYNWLGWSRGRHRIWQNTNVFLRSSDRGRGPRVKRVVVMPVDTEGQDTDFIAERIKDAFFVLDFYNRQFNRDIVQAAVNMSFVLVPCSVRDGFDLSQLDTFEAYIEALIEDNNLTPEEQAELKAKIDQPIGGVDDPLLNLIETCGGGEAPGCFGESFSSIVYVASAGNFGNTFPLFPGALPRVVSVSSQDAAEPAGFKPSPSIFSNSGEVLAPGALYQLSIDTNDPPQWALGYAGTSFSAPAVTVFTALDLMRTEPRCALPAGSRLAHNDPAAYDTPLPDAVDGYCLDE